jgi:hypothetical protein
MITLSNNIQYISILTAIVSSTLKVSAAAGTSSNLVEEHNTNP